MSELSKNIEITQEKLKYLFDIFFKSKINLISFKLSPNYYNNTFDSYELEIEFDFLKEIDPDTSYIFETISKFNKEISNFFREYTINSNGKIVLNLPYEVQPPILFGIDYFFGEKLIIKMIIRVYIG